MKQNYITRHFILTSKGMAPAFKKLLLAFVLFCATTSFIKAQTTVTIGTGTDNQRTSPINRYYNYSASEIIYSGSEIGSNGIITHIGFEKASGDNTVTIDQVMIYMKTTTSATVSNYVDAADYNLVYDGAFPNDNIGWMTVELDTPFVYPATSDNLAVLVVRPYQQYVDPSYPYYAYTTTSGNTNSYYQDDYDLWTSTEYMSANTNRPNVQFTMNALADCVAPTDQPTGLTVSGDSSSAISGSFTAAASAPDAYIVLRSTAASMSADPVDGTAYPVGSELGGATVIQMSASTSFTDTGLSPNSSYNYFVYSANVACSGGPLYYTTGAPSGSANTTTDPTTLVGAANITDESATILWLASGEGGGVETITYALDVATDSGFTTIVNSYTGLTTTSQDITGLADGTTYYIRVKVESEGTYSEGSFVAMNDTTPLTVTGFNEDVIANGVGSASVTTTNAVDAVDYSFFAAGYNPSGTAYTNGLPANRVLTSVGAPAGTIYFMAPYEENNDLRLGADGETGTLTLTHPMSFQKLYFGVTGGSGAASFTATVTYDDATTDTFTGLNAADWFNNSGYIINIGARVNRTNDGVSTASGGPRIYPVTITIPAANQFKDVVSITFTSTTGISNGNNVLNVFNVSGKISTACSGTPNDGVASLSAGTGGVGTTFTATATGVSDSAGITYQWQMSDNGADNWTDVAGATTTVSTITAESAIGTYYYRLVSTCTNTSDMGYSNVVSFTTTPCTPSYSNGSFNWYSNSFSIEEVSFSDDITSSDHDETDVEIPTLTIGATYTFNITTVGWVSVGVAADFDNSGGFGEADEVLALPDYVAGNPYTYTFSVTIPATVTAGTYRLRIWNREANAGAGTSPCGSYAYGSWVDYMITVSATAAVAEVGDHVTLKYYPNPVNGSLNLTSDSVIKTVEVYAVTGQKIKSESADATQVLVDMQNVAKGVYFVTVGFEGSEQQTIRVVKQ